jgi:antitoxin (DNA-binding transcriptional repressor) of toxin-antitoxin stability system
MKERISTLDVRARLGEILNRVDLRHDEFIIERQGHPLAALVPLPRLLQMESLARRHAKEVLDAQRGSDISTEEADEIALQAVREVRQRRRKKA